MNDRDFLHATVVKHRGATDTEIIAQKVDPGEIPAVPFHVF